jgi:hypothetical protein
VARCFFIIRNKENGGDPIFFHSEKYQAGTDPVFFNSKAMPSCRNLILFWQVFPRAPVMPGIREIILHQSATAQAIS